MLLDALDALASEYGFPVIVSTHPRTRNRLTKEMRGGVADLVRFMPPFGFTDFISLQKGAYCVLSDSGTITEEAALLDLPAVTMRDSHERPEGVDAGTLVTSSLEPDRILDAVRVARDGFGTHRKFAGPVADYEADEVSARVVRIVLSYIDQINRKVWYKTSN